MGARSLPIPLLPIVSGSSASENYPEMGFEEISYDLPEADIP
jgi:hypothetical protein